MNDFSPDAMRKAFHDAVAERDAIMERAAPHRAAYEEKRAEIEALELTQLRPLQDKLRAAEGGLFDLNNKIGMLNRALRGETGESA